MANKDYLKQNDGRVHWQYKSGSVITLSCCDNSPTSGRQMDGRLETFSTACDVRRLA